MVLRSGHGHFKGPPCLIVLRVGNFSPNFSIWLERRSCHKGARINPSRLYTPRSAALGIFTLNFYYVYFALIPSRLDIENAWWELIYNLHSVQKRNRQVAHYVFMGRATFARKAKNDILILPPFLSPCCFFNLSFLEGREYVSYASFSPTLFPRRPSFYADEFWIFKLRSRQAADGHKSNSKNVTL
jgi:hypothetical protein